MSYIALPKKRKAKAKPDEDIIRTEPDTNKATGAADENEFVDEVEVEQPAPVNGLTTLADSRLRKAKRCKLADVSESNIPFLNLPAEIRNMIYRYLVVSRNPEPINLNHENTFVPGGIETAILRVNKLVYDEALKIMYAENKCIALVSADLQGISFRHDIAKTITGTARVLRSKREVDMVAHRGLIYQKVVMRLRHLTLQVNMFDRKKMCDHLTSLWCDYLIENYRNTLLILENRSYEGIPMSIVQLHGRDWKLVFNNEFTTSFLALRKSLAPLRLITQELVRRGRLTVEIKGKYPKKWKSLFLHLKKRSGFVTREVKVDRKAIRDEFPEVFGFAESTMPDTDGDEAA